MHAFRHCCQHKRMFFINQASWCMRHNCNTSKYSYWNLHSFALNLVMCFSITGGKIYAQTELNLLSSYGIIVTRGIRYVIYLFLIWRVNFGSWLLQVRYVRPCPQNISIFHRNPIIQWINVFLWKRKYCN